MLRVCLRSAEQTGKADSLIPDSITLQELLLVVLVLFTWPQSADISTLGWVP